MSKIYKKVLVTGGSGLLGSHLIRALLDKNYEVRAITRQRSELNSTGGNSGGQDAIIQEILKQPEWVEGDILDTGFLEEVFAGVTEVYHCAGLVSFFSRDKRRLLEINVTGTANIVNAALHSDVDKLCHVSSVAALGRAENDGFTDENTIWKDSAINSVYGRSKFMSELEVWRGIEEGLNAFIINPSILIGASDPSKGSSRLVTTVAEGLKFYPTGSNGFVDVRDVVRIMIMLMESGITNQKFVVNSVNCSYLELFEKLARCLGVKPPRYKMNRFFGECYRVFKAVYAGVSGKQPVLTRETTETAYQNYRYSNKKLLNAFPDFQYTPFAETIRYVCDDFHGRNKKNCPEYTE